MIAERLRWQLEAWLVTNQEESRAGAISLLRLVPAELTSAQGRQLELFGRSPADDERVGRVLARLQGMLGVEGVLRPVPTGGRSPLDQVRCVPAGDPITSSGREVILPWPGRLPPPSPAVVPNEPPLAELLDDAGHRVAVDARGIASAAPATIVLGGRPGVAVVAWAGPWPLDERWWEHRGRRCARVQVQSAGGEAYLLTLDRGQWRVEGCYD